MPDWAFRATRGPVITTARDPDGDSGDWKFVLLPRDQFSLAKLRTLDKKLAEFEGRAARNFFTSCDFDATDTWS